MLPLQAQFDEAFRATEVERARQKAGAVAQAEQPFKLELEQQRGIRAAEKTAQATVEAAKITAAQQQQQRQTTDVVTADINRILTQLGTAQLPVTGAVGSFLSKVPGTAAADVRFLLDTVRANIAFDKLNQMRQASKTGGALGNVTERELGLLQATMGSLEQAQTQDQFRFNLIRIHNQLLDTVHGPDKGPPRLALPQATRPQSTGLQPPGLSDPLGIRFPKSPISGAP